MRRTTSLLLATIAVAAPGVAEAAGSRHYEGSVAAVPDSRVAFAVVRRDDGRRVRSIAVERVPLACGDRHATAADVTGTRGWAPIVDGHFRFAADDGTRSFRIAGEVHRHRASGTLRISGSFEVDGKRRDCASGRLMWSAARD